MRRLALAFLLSAICCLLSIFCFFYFRDNFSTHYPIKALSAQSLRAGEIPWWNFADGGGQPLAGNPNTLTFYPDNVLYLFLPPHVAFNLHFLIHLVAAWFAMRALSQSRFSAWLYVLSGLALSATAFYTLITAVALIPFALWAAQRRSALFLGTAFGLLALATEPVTILGTAIAVAMVVVVECKMQNAECKMTSRDFAFCILHFAFAAFVAIVIASPQLVAYSEIAREVERAHGFSAQTVLNASLPPQRLLELVIGPVFALPNQYLFVSLFLGLIAIPALFQRSRYAAIALLMLFLALGAWNPIVAGVVNALPSIRIGRYPEKFMMVAVAALAVLAGMFYERSQQKRIWLLITFVPIAIWLPQTLLVDWFAPYRIERATPSPQRIVQVELPGGRIPSRDDYRNRAAHRDPLFGAIGGTEYALVRSPEDMHSTLSRIALERWNATKNPRWLAIATAPPATIIPHAVAAHSVNDAVRVIETSAEHVTPAAFDSSPDARVLSYARSGQTIAIDAIGPALVMINESYFTAWVADGFRTTPVDLDRLGVLVPAGSHHIELRFGRRRTPTIAAWLLSSLALLAAAIALRIEVLDRRAGEVERAADEDRALA